jgi:hypothetical protein
VYSHSTEITIYVFPEKELRGLSPNSYIHVSVSDLNIPRIAPHIWLQLNRQTDPGNIKISHRYVQYACRNWETEHFNSVSVLEITRLHSLIFGNT